MAGCPHNPEYECFECTETEHARRHPELVDGCMACKLDTIQVAEKVVSRRTGGAPAGNNNSWERGFALDGRGVPLLDASGEPIGVKQYAQKRHALEAERRRLANDPAPFAKT